MKQRARMSDKGIRELHTPAKFQARVGDYLGLDKYGTALVRWDGNKSVTGFHPTYIEVFEDDTEPEPEAPIWS